jgi:hypothetical protein
MSTVAKVYLYKKTSPATPEQETVLEFNANYTERNKEWAKYTPALTLRMQVNETAALNFEEGKYYTLTFDEDNGED